MTMRFSRLGVLLQSSFRKIAANSVWKLIPQNHIYAIALFLANVLLLLHRINRFESLFGIKLEGYIIIQNDLKQNFLGLILTKLGWRKVSFPIPITTSGLDLLIDLHSKHERLIICSGHFPLNRIVHQVLGELSLPYVVVSTVKGFDMWGNFKRPNCKILPVSAHVFLHAKRHLLAGDIVITDIDRVNKGQVIEVSPNLFRLAQLTATPVLFVRTALTDQGRILVHFEAPSQLLIQSADINFCLQEFIRFLDQSSQFPASI
jgi:hypothetical protein